MNEFPISTLVIALFLLLMCAVVAFFALARRASTTGPKITAKCMKEAGIPTSPSSLREW